VKYYINKILITCLVLSLSIISLHAERNIKREGEGYSESRLKAELLAYGRARDALMKVLCDSVVQFCEEAEVLRDVDGEYLSIKFFKKEEKPFKFYFHESNLLNTITVVRKECNRDKKGKYRARCVLSAPEKDYEEATNIITFQMLRYMSNFVH